VNFLPAGRWWLVSRKPLQIASAKDVVARCQTAKRRFHRPTIVPRQEEVVQHRSAKYDLNDSYSESDVDLVGIVDSGVRSGVIVLRTRPAPSAWLMVRREGGGYIFCRPDRLPTGTLTLDAELAMRKRHIEEFGHAELRRSAALASSLEPLDDALIRRAGAHQLAASRESRSSRRVVRAGSSRGDPSGSDPDEPHDPLAARPGRAASGWSA
jgi:hypothetical protein